MIRLAHPWFLMLLFLLIPMLWYGRDTGGQIRFSNLKLVKNLKGLGKFHPRHILLVLRVLALVLLIIGMTRPQTGKKFSEVDSEGVDMMLALDTSGSMMALDFFLEKQRVDRLTVIKSVVEDFIKKRPSDRMGLVVFGTEAFTQCPLTLDHGILVEFLKKLQIGMAGENTAIGSAIGTSVKRLKDLKAKSKVIILLTDGSSNSGDISPLQAAELAKTYNVKIYTIGVGTKGKAPFMVDSFFGKQMAYMNVEFDEETLKQIASATGGRYFAANNVEELSQIYGEIDRLEKTKVKVKEYTEYNEVFHYFLILGILLLILEIVLANTRLRKIP